MSVYVIADLHLSNGTPKLVAAFTSFVNKLKSGDELYIIGDLFNFFVGLDNINLAQKKVADELKKAKQRGISSYFIKGNRDFLITSKEASLLGMELLDDIAIIDRYGMRILLSHGDLFCTNDLQYQKYYRFVNNKCLQLLFRMLPMAIRRNIASRIRQQSKESHYHRRDPLIYGVVPDSIEKLVCNKGSFNVVHGHIHDFSCFENETKSIHKRYVLGAWGSSFSYWALHENREVSFKEIDLSLIDSLESLP